MMIVLAFGFGVLVRVVHLLDDDLSIHFQSVVMASLRGLIGIGSSSHHLGYAGYSWTSLSQLSIVLIGLIWAIGIWTAPWRHRLTGDEPAHRRAVELVRKFGVDTLAPFALRRDKELYFHTSSTAPFQGATSVIAYRVVRGIAVVAGDPIGPEEMIEETLQSFVDHVHTRGWKVAVIGVSEREVHHYRAVGLQDLYHGDEAIIDIAGFSLDGGARKSVRQAVHRVARKGYQASVHTIGALTPQLRHELTAIDRSWLGNRPRKGFVMELDSLFGLSKDDAVFVVGRDPDGHIAGFLHVAVCHASAMLSLSSMPRRSDTPNGFNSWLIVELTKWAADNGYRAISLNFSPFAGLLSADAELSSIQRVEREALLRIKGLLSLQLDNLLLFNRGFSPRFEARYCVFERLSDLPRVAIAAMAAEGYLPFAERLRRWEGEDIVRSGWSVGRRNPRHAPVEP